MIIPTVDAISNQKNKNNGSKFNLEKLPVYALKFTLWIPVTNTRGKICVFQVLLTVFLHVIGCLAASLFTFGGYTSHVMKFVPLPIVYANCSLVVYSIINAFLFLFKSWRKSKKSVVGILERLEVIRTISGQWCKEQKAIIVIAMATWVATSLYRFAYTLPINYNSVVTNTVFYHFIQNEQLTQCVSLTHLIYSSYLRMLYLLFPIFIGYLCLTVEVGVETLQNRLRTNSKEPFDLFVAELTKITDFCELIEETYQLNIGVLLFICVSDLVGNMYMTVVFHECFEFWFLAFPILTSSLAISFLMVMGGRLRDQVCVTHNTAQAQ